MTTIAPFAAGSYAATRAAQRSSLILSQFDELNRQLTTQRASDTFGGLGVGRRTSLDARAKIATLDGYNAAIDRGQLRVKLASASLQQISTVLTSTRSDLTLLSRGSATPGRDAIRQSITDRLEAVVDALNQQMDGSYLFSGRATATEPVETVAHILDGDPAKGLAGVRTLIAERKAAYLGAGTTKTGRLTLTPPAAGGTTLSLAEDANASVRANFGFTVVGATSSNAGALTVTNTARTASSGTFSFASQPAEGDAVRVAVNGTDGKQTFVDLVASANPPSGSTTSFQIGATAAATAANLTTLMSGKAVASAQSATPPGVGLTLSGGSAGSIGLAVNAQPVAGDTLTVTLGLRDGTTTTFTLTASADGAAAGSFAIGATAAATAANLAAAIGTALDTAATGPLAAASATLAADDFFAGSATPGLAPRRIAGGSPFTGATGFSAAASTSTVVWYHGESSADPRSSSLVQVGPNQSVGTGAQANEPALRNALAALAAYAGESFGTGTSEDARHAALADRIGVALTPAAGDPSVNDIAAQLARASASMTTAKSDNTAAGALLDDAIQGVEGVSTEEVATKLLALQTQLQASYQTTAMLSKLSLVNFL